jgi:sortase A
MDEQLRQRLDEARRLILAADASDHYLGYPATASRLVFYNLDKLKKGDEASLKDREGRVYRYRVSESFTAWPDDSWVMGQEVGRDMLTLQTCIPPNFDKRLIVRADRA